RQDQDGGVGREIGRVIPEPLAAEIGFGQFLPLHHRAHRAVEHENAPGQQVVELTLHVACHGFACRGFAPPDGFVPAAISTVNGSPALRAPTPTVTFVRPATASIRWSSWSSNPSRRSPSLERTHSSWWARRSSSSTRPFGTVTLAASNTARAGSSA